VKRINQGPRSSAIRSSIQKNGVVTSAKEHTMIGASKVSKQSLTKDLVKENQLSSPDEDG